jgi:hypothetical protein
MYLKNQLSTRIDWRICGGEPAWHGRNPPPVLLFNRYMRVKALCSRHRASAVGVTAEGEAMLECAPTGSKHSGGKT